MRNLLFYDRFALYSRGLANIYVKALLSLGYQVIWCLFETGAETEQIVMLPYYPERRQQEPFRGLPFPEDEEFIFSGGSAYKIEGSSQVEQIVSKLLDRHSALKFIFATRDRSEKLDALASRYENRFFIIQERMDLEELLRRARFFLSTYPVPGGLMIQYALMNQCVPLCLADKNNICSDPASYLLQPEKIDFVFYEPDELLEKADLLLSGCEEQKETYEHFVIAEKDFERNLGYVLDGESTDYDYHEEEIDMSVFHSYFENRLTPDNFRESLRQSNNKWLAEKYPELFNGSSGF